MKATKRQFEEFVEIKKTGSVNMMNVKKVIDIAQMAGVRMSRDECLDIIHNFNEYEKEYVKEKA